MSVGGTKVKAGKASKQAKKQGNLPAQKYLSEPLTPQRLRKETRASTNLAYRPTERAINAEKRASQQRTKNVGTWWNEYLATVQGSQADTAAAYANAATQGQAQINEASSQDNANTAKLSAEAAQSAATRGQTAPSQPAERGAAAQAQRNYLGAAFGSANAQRGANQGAYLADQKRIGAGQRVSSQIAEQKRTRSIESDKRELAKQRGDYASKFRGEAIDRNHDYLIQRQAYGLDKAKYHSEAAAASAAAATEAHQQEIENRQKQEEIGNETRKTNKEGKKGGKTQSERNAAKEGRRNATATAKTLFEKRQWPSWGALTQQVAKESEVSPAEARAAVKKIREQVEREQSLEATPAGR